MSKLAWYAGRATAMSPREVVWRARRVVDTLTNRDGLREYADSRMLTNLGSDWTALLQDFRDGIGRPVLLDQERAGEVQSQHLAQVGRLLVEADRVLAGDRTYFGHRTVNVGRAVDWNHDPIADYHWPAVAGSRIDHRAGRRDPKWIWELNRLQHLPLLAQAWLYTDELRYSEAAFAHLDSWLDQNPIGCGIAWRGAFEVGVRAISVALGVQGLRNAPAMTTSRYRRIVRMLDASARHCWHARSRFSSANNHVVGELAGLVTVHLLFPELSAPAALYGRALDTLTEEADRLILPDGAGAEQSVAYQIFTAELLAVVVALLQLSGERVPVRLTEALNRGAAYLVSLVGTEDPDPRYGDDDDSFAVRLGAEHKRTVREHLGIVGAVTAHATAARYGHRTLTSAWLGNALCTSAGRPGVGGDDPTPSAYAPNGGLVVLRHGRRRLTMDVGPLGYPATAAHGHADALGITLSVEGRELVTDPGTASFYGDPAVRDMHRGTRTHATVCIDNVDQSLIGGPFYWRSRARTTVHSVDLDRGVVDAEHDGYCRLDDPVVHRRWLIAPAEDPVVIVVDLICGLSDHDVAVSWPLHPDLVSTPTRTGQRITRDGEPVLELCYAATTTIWPEQVRADGASNLGWWSDRLEARRPAWLVGARCRSGAPVAILSVLHVGDPGVTAAPRIVREGSALKVSWYQQDGQHGLTIDAGRRGAVSGVSLSPLMGLVGKR